MPVVTEHVEVERKPDRKPKLGGGGPGKIPHRFGYGGGDDGDPERNENLNQQRERHLTYRILMAICMVAITTLFVALTVAYLWRRSVEHYDQDLNRVVHVWTPLALPYLQLWINSAVLLLSSGTLELSRRRLLKQSEFAALGIVPPAGRREMPWLFLTLLLGLAFLGGQVEVWNILRRQGLFLAWNSRSSFFYAFTGLHGAHLLCGLVALMWVIFRSWKPRGADFRQVTLQATGWYWHYMGILWMAIFALLYFTRK
ncbi:MAG: cytochrome c oxidase subunit 3 [Acidobacteriia bacterium]|nr:cytochrome c oxidase subunit 3 [Terriglobia bacterium]